MARESIDINGADQVLAMLQQFPAELVSRRGGPVKAALRKAAIVIQQEARANVQRIMDAPNEDADSPSAKKPTGLLLKSIIVSRDPRPEQSGANERYLVRVKRAKYPPERAGKETVTTGKVGSLLEYGTARRPAMPWLRPAFEAKKGMAVDVFMRELRAGVERITRKLSRKG